MLNSNNNNQSNNKKRDDKAASKDNPNSKTFKAAGGLSNSVIINKGKKIISSAKFNKMVRALYNLSIYSLLRHPSNSSRLRRLTKNSAAG